MKFYVIGSREIVIAFKLIGIEGTVAETKDECLEAFNRIIGKGGEINVPVSEVPKILILTEAVAAKIEKEEIAWLKKGQYPLIVEVPELNGHLAGRKSLTAAINEAVGVEV